MSEQKTISHDDYLKALGLFTLANSHYVKAQEISDTLYETVGLDEYGSRIGDLVWDKGVTILQFDKALKESGVKVSPSTPALADLDGEK